MPGAMHIKINDKAFNAHLRRATATGLRRAAAFLHAQCRIAVSKPNTGTRHKGGQTTYDDPSPPGQPPHLRTGFGRSQIVWEYNGKDRKPAVRVGVKKAGLYMIYLELGTRRVAARPWLRRTLMKHKRQIGMLAATGGRRGGR